jgi:hypothetical protein
MRNITEKLQNSTKVSRLYCIWVTVHDDGGDRLVSIWIDREMAAFKGCARETSVGTGTAATRCAGHQEEDVHPLVGEHLTSILPPANKDEG